MACSRYGSTQVEVINSMKGLSWNYLHESSCRNLGQWTAKIVKWKISIETSQFKRISTNTGKKKSKRKQGLQSIHKSKAINGFKWIRQNSRQAIIVQFPVDQIIRQWAKNEKSLCTMTMRALLKIKNGVRKFLQIVEVLEIPKWTWDAPRELVIWHVKSL